MKTELMLTMVAAGLLCGGVTAQEHDYYKHLRYPSKLVPGVGLDKVEQEGGPKAVGYKRRIVQWWPRKGQDFVDIPKGAPLREWTRDKGQIDGEASAGVCRSWTASDPQTFKAHLIAFRSFGDSTYKSIPAAVLRTEDGRQRAVLYYSPVHFMISPEDKDFIHEWWEKAYPSLYAKVSQDDAETGVKFPMKRWTEAAPKFNAMELPKDSEYPRWGQKDDDLVHETKHFTLLARPKRWGIPGAWINVKDREAQNKYRKFIMEWVENFWTYVEATGANLPYWRRPGRNYKYIIHIHPSRCAGGWGHCGISNASPVALGHEFFHGQPHGGWNGMYIETWCNAGQHTAHPGELQMFPGNFQYPWRNVNFRGYGSSLWAFVLGDNPNWGYGIQIVAGCLGSPEEFTPYHTVARLGQKRGLWKNGVRGFGDWFGEYAARMVTCDFIEQHMIQSKYGMPEMSYVYPVCGHKNRYRISNAEAPKWTGYNIIRLKPAEGAKEITVELHGIHDPEMHSDWRACIVTVDANGRPHYSPLWNKGPMRFALKDSDTHVWLTVAACPSAFPVLPTGKGKHTNVTGWFLTGTHSPRFPYEVTLTGCRPGVPHRRQGDVINFDELYGRCDYNNTYLNYPVKWEVPIPLTEKKAKLAQEKLAAMLPRIKHSAKVMQDKIDAKKAWKGYWWIKKNNMHNDLIRRVKFLQDNAKGRPHPNGGGFVADSARVAKTAYVGPNAMVLDGATVKDNACIKEFAVVLGPKTVISGNAKVSGRAWVFGDIKVTGNARILEAATVSTIWRQPWTRGKHLEGQAEITGSAVIKGEQYLLLAFAKDQVVTGGVVVDYHGTVENKSSGVFKHGRFYRCSDRRPPGFGGGANAGALYANWQFNQPKAVLLEDAYVNNNGILYGRPQFAEDGDHRCFVFNGKDQYAEAPPSVADFGELTIDMLVNRSAGKGGRLFDFGTGEDECFYLSIGARNGKPTLAARHKGKSYSLTATQGIAADKWARVRVEMDGSNASIYIDGKNAGKGKFTFRPRDVFIGDRPEGNFIACSRKKDEFFKGRMDHFRIYRKVHEDFASVGPPPAALTIIQEWSQKDQGRSDAWAGRRKAKEAELKAGRYGKIHEEIRKLHQEKSALYRTEKLKELEAGVRKADSARQALDRKIHESLSALQQKTAKEINELRQKMDGITRQIRASSAYVKLTEEIQACQKRRGEMESKLQESPKLKAIAVKAETINEQKRKAEELIKQLPEVKKLIELSEQEKDGQKKRALVDKYNRLLGAKRSTDPGWQKAEVAAQGLNRLREETLRNERKAHVGLAKNANERHRLEKKRGALEARLRKSNPQLSKLAKAIAAKQEPLNAKRKQIEEKVRGADEYKKAQAACAAARKAVEDQKKRLQKEKAGQAAKLDTRIADLHKEANALFRKGMQSAGVFGSNPYPGRRAGEMHDVQRSMVYHTTADWDDTVHDDGGRPEKEAPQKMRDWLKRVRGY